MTGWRVLVLPGLGGSGPTHWQTRWERLYGYERVEQRDWDKPERDVWLSQLEQTVAATQARVVLVAHSLGAALAAHFAATAAPGRIAAALLVAPADVEDTHCTPDETRSFAPLPHLRFAFPATLVASRNDPYVRFERAAQLAATWGTQLVDLGASGHINADSGLGDWAQGHELLRQVVSARERDI